jgi:dethiobiotin synthetase
MRYIVAGIGTEVGKTVVSAILTQALNADYWKPIQAGCCEATDSMIVQDLIRPIDVVCHPEAYQFLEPVSPHLAAQLEGIEINPESIRLPQTEKPLVIEMAGGSYLL